MGVWNDAGMRDTELYERLLGLKGALESEGGENGC